MLRLCVLILGDEFVINDSRLLINSASSAGLYDGSYMYHPSTAARSGHGVGV